MPSPDILSSLALIIAAAPFPVYGVVDHPLDLFLCSYGLCLSEQDQVVHVDLDFTSSRYSSHPPCTPQTQALTFISMDAREKHGDRKWTLDDVNLGPFLRGQIQQAKNLFLWEGTLSLAGTAFSGHIRHYASPFWISAFLLKSEETIVMGDAYGPSCDELVHLLEGLQVFNGRDELIRQYQEEIVSRMRSIYMISREDHLPRTLAGMMAAVQFPVYGIVDRPLDLLLCHHELGFARDPTDFQHVTHLTNVHLTFTSPRYSSHPPHVPQSHNLTLDSRDAWVERKDRELTLDDVKLGPFLEGLVGQAGNPFLWEGTFFLEGTQFTGTLRYYPAPLRISAFLLKSEETILLGTAYGPSCDELVQLLEGLQVLNWRDQLIRQYQEELPS